MQAAVSLSQPDKFQNFVDKRRGNYDRLMTRIKATGLDEYYHLPVATPGSNPSWFGLLLTIRNGMPLIHRNVTAALEEHKAGTRLLFVSNLI